MPGFGRDKPPEHARAQDVRDDVVLMRGGFELGPVHVLVESASAFTHPLPQVGLTPCCLLLTAHSLLFIPPQILCRSKRNHGGDHTSKTTRYDRQGAADQRSDCARFDLA